MNSNLNMREMREGKAVLSSYPRRVVLELTNDCQFNCVMCGRGYAGFKKTYLDTACLKKLENVFNYAEEVAFLGWGEATLHPEFLQILKFLDQFPVKKYLCTNGGSPDVLKKAVNQYGLDILAVSLDGACRKVNSSIRRGSDYDSILAMLREIVAEKKIRGKDKPYINFVMTAMKSNLHQLPGLIKLARRLGIQEVKVVYLTVFGNTLAGESLYNCQDEVKKVFGEAITLAASLGIKLVLPYVQGEDSVGEKHHRDCFVGWRDLFIGSDGFIRPCMSTSQKLQNFHDYNNFADLWNSVEFVRFRKTVNNPVNMLQECKSCYQSSHANWNRKEAFFQIGQCFAPKWE